ncbi:MULTISPECIES: hypothetical protein [Clostridium]|uniref:Uncharacterized protein n=1 Tax=Clostridium saccharoperbutylacetonicum N1-4(HMT) TaxID=931276 RepID=M1M120_9CLOT|nr:MULTISPECIES: hypothetical protein [Clostridium]AGF59245.1 hypothetical protein Cspa_c55000 [Clostridium saccharoperbutylacetonicum N1-4(HMT)]AQR97914.1 hypothetical protein CLSAP_52470 [Clostridium saccharoperbutylacetonicum]NRT59967.1 hypothetical protein [Clostridium saccharoperbutylacetonicum]NSB23279.1 hypothetical protein [Clostridium saccharoperbutylacetonicum]NSB33806.1 hypothetical protein [Clostridium saccharoperbutylacetonicum]
MRELKIEEQKSICGGTHYQFTDLTTGYIYVYDNRDKANSIRLDLRSQGHKVSSITSYN